MIQFALIVALCGDTSSGCQHKFAGWYKTEWECRLAAQRLRATSYKCVIGVNESGVTK